MTSNKILQLCKQDNARIQHNEDRIKIMQFYVTNTVKLHKPHRKKNKKILFSDANVQCQEK